MAEIGAGVEALAGERRERAVGFVPPLGEAEGGVGGAFDASSGQVGGEVDGPQVDGLEERVEIVVPLRWVVGLLLPAERARRAEAARRAYFTRLALRSSQARRRGSGRR